MIKINRRTPESDWHIKYLMADGHESCLHLATEVLDKEFGISFHCDETNTKIEGETLTYEDLADQWVDHWRKHLRKKDHQNACDGDIAILQGDMGKHIGIIKKVGNELYMLHGGANQKAMFEPLKNVKFFRLEMLFSIVEEHSTDGEYLKDAEVRLPLLAVAAFAATAAITGSLIVATLAAALVYFGGKYLQGFLQPDVPQIEQGQTEQPSPTYNLAGGFNSNRLNYPMPLVMGEVKMFPQFASKPWTRYHAGNQIWVAKLNFGPGDIEVRDGKINGVSLREQGVSAYEVNWKQSKVSFDAGRTITDITNNTPGNSPITTPIVPDTSFLPDREGSVIPFTVTLEARPSNRDIGSQEIVFARNIRRIRFANLPAGININGESAYWVPPHTPSNTPGRTVWNAPVMQGLFPAEYIQRSGGDMTNTGSGWVVTKNGIPSDFRSEALAPNAFPGPHLVFANENTYPVTLRGWIESQDPEAQFGGNIEDNVVTYEGVKMDAPDIGEVRYGIDSSSFYGQEKAVNIRLLSDRRGEPMNEMPGDFPPVGERSLPHRLEVDFGGFVHKVAEGDEDPAAAHWDRSVGFPAGEGYPLYLNRSDPMIQALIKDGGYNAATVFGLSHYGRQHIAIINGGKVKVDPGGTAWNFSQFLMSFAKDDDTQGYPSNGSWVTELPAQFYLDRKTINLAAAAGTFSSIHNRGEADVITVEGQNTDRIRATMGMSVDGMRQAQDAENSIELRFRRMGGKSPSRGDQDELEVEQVKAFYNDYPENYPDVNLTILNVVASELLNGRVSNISYIVEQKIPVYDIGVGMWTDETNYLTTPGKTYNTVNVGAQRDTDGKVIKRPNANPAALFRWFAKGQRATTDANGNTLPSNAKGEIYWGYGLSDDKIDTNRLEDWFIFCDGLNIEFNAVIDTPRRVYEVLNLIARVGRGAVSWANGQLGVVYDVASQEPFRVYGFDGDAEEQLKECGLTNTSVKGLIKNSLQIDYQVRQPAQGLEASFRNRDNDYEVDTFKLPGYRVTIEKGLEEVLHPESYEQRELFGVVDREQAEDFARDLLVKNTYRSRTARFRISGTDFLITAGDMIGIQNKTGLGPDPFTGKDWHNHLVTNVAYSTTGETTVTAVYNPPITGRGITNKPDESTAEFVISNNSNPAKEAGIVPFSNLIIQSSATAKGGGYLVYDTQTRPVNGVLLLGRWNGGRPTTAGDAGFAPYTQEGGTYVLQDSAPTETRHIRIYKTGGANEYSIQFLNASLATINLDRINNGASVSVSVGFGELSPFSGTLIDKTPTATGGTIRVNVTNGLANAQNLVATAGSTNADAAVNLTLRDNARRYFSFNKDDAVNVDRSANLNNLNEGDVIRVCATFKQTSFTPLTTIDPAFTVGVVGFTKTLQYRMRVRNVYKPGTPPETYEVVFDLVGDNPNLPTTVRDSTQFTEDVIILRKETNP